MTALAPKSFQAIEIRVRGRVQGVGFRPTIWRMAHELGLAGEVRNDAEGVLLRVGGERAADRRVSRRHQARTAAARAHRCDRDAGLYRRAFGRIPHCRECGRRSKDRDRARRGHLQSVRRRIARPHRSPLPLSVHELHALWTAAEHRYRHPLRSGDYDHGALCAVSRLPRRIWKSERSAVPCRSRRLSELRPDGGVDRARGACAAKRRRRRRRRACGKTHRRRRDRRGQGDRRLSARLRCRPMPRRSAACAG